MTLLISPPPDGAAERTKTPGLLSILDEARDERLERALAWVAGRPTRLEVVAVAVVVLILGVMF